MNNKHSCLFGLVEESLLYNNKKSTAVGLGRLNHSYKCSLKYSWSVLVVFEYMVETERIEKNGG